MLLSLGLHGLLLAIPLPPAAQPGDSEVLADDDAAPEATIAITSLPPPLNEPSPVESAAPAVTHSAPAPPTAPAPPSAPTAEILAPQSPEQETDLAPAPESALDPAAFTPPPSAAPPVEQPPVEQPPVEQPSGNILGVPLLPGSQELTNPAESLAGDRLALHLRDGATHPDIEGQFLVPTTETDPEAWFAVAYRPVLSEAYSVRNEGAFARAPKYSLTRDSYDRFAFLTVEWVTDRRQMLVTVWRRNPT